MASSWLSKCPDLESRVNFPHPSSASQAAMSPPSAPSPPLITQPTGLPQPCTSGKSLCTHDLQVHDLASRACTMTLQSGRRPTVSSSLWVGLLLAEDTRRGTAMVLAQYVSSVAVSVALSVTSGAACAKETSLARQLIRGHSAAMHRIIACRAWPVSPWPAVDALARERPQAASQPPCVISTTCKSCNIWRMIDKEHLLWTL